ncbi:MAG: hypothetical protein COA43_01850 [Robiginitomaculum sp.]|nr:MAG: hypothetical protein COA43_01850 [Robiginitomaculum sp.]
MNIKKILNCGAVVKCARGVCLSGAFLSSTAAYAAGTVADTTVTNTFTLDYSIGSTAQTTINGAAVTFKVDRVIDLTISSLGEKDVPPSATGQKIVFLLTNTGNFPQGYSLVAANLTSGDQFDVAVTGIKYYSQTVGQGYDQNAVAADYSGEIGNINPDEAVWVIVHGTIPNAASVSDSDKATISLLATTLESATSTLGSPAAVVVASTSNDMNVTDNVFADGDGDGAGTADAVTDGKYYHIESYNITSPNITTTKVVSVFKQDGSSGCETIPGTAVSSGFAIPGACIEYVITVVNGGSIDADSIVIVDQLRTELIFMAASTSNFTNVTLVKPDQDTACTGSNCEVKITGATLASGGADGKLIIRAKIKN